MTPDTTWADQMQALLDRDAIREVLHLYCRAINRADRHLLDRVYHDDAFDDHGWFRGSADEFATQQIERVIARDHPAVHCVTNELIDLRGDVAFVESYVLAFRRETGQQGRDHFFAGRYLDRFERREGTWKIAHRVVVHDLSRTDPLREENISHRTGFLLGRRSSADPVYEHLQIE